MTQPSGKTEPMDPHVIAVVLAAALLHATWNALAKGRQGDDPMIGAVVIAAGAAVVSLGMLAAVGWPGQSSMPYVIASGVIHVGYFLLLGLSYRLADYSAIYPLTRGTAPLITTGLSVALIGERVAPAMLAGVALLSLGVLGLGFQALRRGGLDRRGIAVAAINIAVIVAYTLIDGIGARASGNPIAYVALMMLLTGMLLLPIMLAWRPMEVIGGLASKCPLGLFGGAMVMASYGAALWAMTRAPIGAVAALRETSVLFGTLIAVAFMGERFSPVRALATVAIFAGLAAMRLI